MKTSFNLRPFLSLLIALLLCGAVAAQGQGFSLFGKFIDKSSNEPLIGVNIQLTNQLDTTRKMGLTSDVDGGFQFTRLRPGSYKLQASYIGYQPFEQIITMERADKTLGVLAMEQGALQLQGVTVEAVQIRAQQKGDTTEYNANAFKVNPDADAEQLVQKMPGITVENGEVKAQGETVRRVTVDGREFFGEDATLALRNLPAEVIDKIQVFDRMSDQAQFTGFDDGNAEKTINITTRGGMNNAQFGKIYAGYGSDERYAGGGSISFFDKQQRISVVGLFNNVNQQNFSSQDLLGLTGSNNTRRFGGGGGMGRGRGGFGGGSNANDFLVGQQGGINTTNSFGLNYSNNWGTKLKLTGSYFFNNTRNETQSVLERAFFLEDGSQFYDETNDADSKNFNHRLNARIEYTIDSSNSIIITPRLSFQDNRSLSLLQGFNSLENADLLNKTSNDYSADNTGYNLSNNILYRHSFGKRGRTLSVDISTILNDNSGNSQLYSENEFFDSPQPDQIVDQRSDNASASQTYAIGLNYTEPIGAKSMLQFNYRPAFTNNNAEQTTNLVDANGEYTILDSLLSNDFDNEVLTQRGGLSYRLRGEKWNLSIGSDYQNVQLNSAQNFPLLLDVEKSFDNLLPNAFFMYNPSRTTNLRMFYRTFTNTPSITQLQNVINNSNPLALRTGNPDLKQQYSHTVGGRFNTTNAAKAQTFFIFANLTYNGDYIANSTFIASRDTVLQEGITLNRGAQFTRPVNMEGAWSVRSFMTYGFPIKWIKSNLNFNAGFTYNRTPGLINNAMNEAKNYNFNSGVVIGSNISQNLDFTISYAANYSIVENTLQPELDNNYFYHNAGLRFNWLLLKKLVISSDINQTLYSGLGDEFDQNFFLWNAGIGYKFLKGNAAELRLSAFDLLKQNNSISRNVTETYVEDNLTQVLTQYFMLTFTYNLRNFGTPPPPAPQGERNWGGFPPRN